MSNYNATVKKIIKTLKGFRCVKAISYFGAHAIGYADEHSDVDLYSFYIGKPPSSKEKEKIWSKMNIDVRKPHPMFDRFFVNNKEAGQIFWLDVSNVQKNVDLFKQGLYNEFEEEICKSIQNIKIIWDPKGILKKWKITTKYPEKFRKQKCRLRLSGVPRAFFDVETALKRHNIFFAEYRVNQAFEVVLEAIYALNRRYYFYPKWLGKDFNRFKFVPKNAYELVTKFYTSTDLSEKLEILKNLFWSTKKLLRKKSAHSISIYQSTIIKIGTTLKLKKLFH